MPDLSFFYKIRYLCSMYYRLEQSATVTAHHDFSFGFSPFAQDSLL